VAALDARENMKRALPQSAIATICENWPRSRIPCKPPQRAPARALAPVRLKLAANAQSWMCTWWKIP